MAILTLQKRSRELGRIRIGQQVESGNGKMRPEKLDRFRITSASQPLIERIAELYGGEAQPWDNHGSPQFEVITTTTRLPVLVPPQPVSQYFEQWSGGGCQRRCDGVTELLKDRPCLCGPDPEDRACKPTTRLNVVLRDVAGIGVFRLESHGYYSATELPEVAEFLARAGGYIPAWLSLEQRTVIRDGRTRRWMVPILEVDVTPSQLLSGNGSVAKEITAPPLAIEPTSVSTESPAPNGNSKGKLSVDEIDMARNQIAAAMDLDQLHAVWSGFAEHFVIPPELKKVFAARGEELKRGSKSADANVDVLWQQVLVSAPEGWTTQQIEARFTEVTKVSVNTATAAHMQQYLDAVSAGSDFDTLWQQVIERAPEEWSEQQLADDFWRITGKAPNDAAAADVQRYLDVMATGGGKA